MIVDLPLTRDLLREALEGMEPDLDQCSGSVRLQLYRTGEDILVNGALKAMVTLPCGACLKPAGILVDMPVRMVFTPADEGGADEPQGDDAAVLDDVDVGHHDSVMLDLAPMVREQIILSVPMAPRCKEGCKGLCLTCGGDRNERDCGHTVELGDVRFAALKDLNLKS